MDLQNEKMNQVPFCTCTKLTCPNHPQNHELGCTKCIAKNLGLGEIPTCFFKQLDQEYHGPGYFYQDFSALVQKKKKLRVPVSEIMEKMIEFSDDNIHDIEHLIKVWTYAKTIGELEKIDEKTQYILEIAAITHDIACPFCREKYGNANGKYQEIEGDPIVRDFLSDTGVSHEVIDRVAYLVGHHHTIENIEGMDYQILIEADYIVNASEMGYTKENIMNFVDKVMKTESGKSLCLKVLFGMN